MVLKLGYAPPCYCRFVKTPQSSEDESVHGGVLRVFRACVQSTWKLKIVFVSRNLVYDCCHSCAPTAGGLCVILCYLLEHFMRTAYVACLTLHILLQSETQSLCATIAWADPSNHVSTCLSRFTIGTFPVDDVFKRFMVFVTLIGSRNFAQRSE